MRWVWGYFFTGVQIGFNKSDIGFGFCIHENQIEFKFLDFYILLITWKKMPLFGFMAQFHIATYSYFLWLHIVKPFLFEKELKKSSHL
jgi:hypothetical protein